jgi:hypothetical protein
MVLAALLLSALQPGTQPDPLTFDLHCMIAASSMRESQDPSARANGTAAALFFFGRVDARLSEAELERRLVAESAAILAEDRGQLMRACGAFMSARGQALIGIGQRISAREHGTATQ